ncbi:MAG: HK97 family phage prohead protease [Pseudomonadota bacterium]
MIIDNQDAPAFVARLEGYASIFEAPDENGDVVARGAFAAGLRAARAGRSVKMLYQHDAKTPIGRWISLIEDARGLFVSGEIILSSDRAREVYALIDGGAIDGLSIGFQTVKSTPRPGGRRILAADLWEISVVTFPMAPGARITRLGPPKPRRPFAAPPDMSPLAPNAPDEAAFSAAVRAAASVLSA